MNRNNRVQNWKAGIAILSLAFFVGCTQSGSLSKAALNGANTAGGSGAGGSGGGSGSGSGGDNQTAPANGNAAVKNFNQYYNALRLATGNVTQNAVATSTTKGSPTTTAISYFNTAAANVLPQDNQASSLTASAAETYPKLASYFAADFIIADLALPAASRKALGPVGTVTTTATSTAFTQAIAEQVGANEIALFLNRPATAADTAAIDCGFYIGFRHHPNDDAGLADCACCFDSADGGARAFGNHDCDFGI